MVGSVTEVGALLRRIAKQALILSRLRIRVDELVRLVKVSQASSGLWLDLDKVPVTGGSTTTCTFGMLSQWIDYSNLRARQQVNKPSLIEVVDPANPSFVLAVKGLALSMDWQEASRP